jgi:hypothetical protein
VNAATMRVFQCATHRFTVVADDRGEVSSRGTVGHRANDCPACNQAVTDAFQYAELGR